MESIASYQVVHVPEIGSNCSHSKGSLSCLPHTHKMGLGLRRLLGISRAVARFNKGRRISKEKIDRCYFMAIKIAFIILGAILLWRTWQNYVDWQNMSSYMASPIDQLVCDAIECAEKECSKTYATVNGKNFFERNPGPSAYERIKCCCPPGRQAGILQMGSLLFLCDDCVTTAIWAIVIYIVIFLFFLNITPAPKKNDDQGLREESYRNERAEGSALTIGTLSSVDPPTMTIRTPTTNADSQGLNPNINDLMLPLYPSTTPMRTSATNQTDDSTSIRDLLLSLSTRRPKDIQATDDSTTAIVSSRVFNVSVIVRRRGCVVLFFLSFLF